MSAHRSTPVNRNELGELPGLTQSGPRVRRVSGSRRGSTRRRYGYICYTSRIDSAGSLKVWRVLIVDGNEVVRIEKSVASEVADMAGCNAGLRSQRTKWPLSEVFHRQIKPINGQFIIYRASIGLGLP